MDSKPKSTTILIKIIVAIIGLLALLFAYFSTSSTEKHCLQGHYKTVGDDYTAHPKNVWVCDKYINE